MFHFGRTLLLWSCAAMALTGVPSARAQDIDSTGVIEPKGVDWVGVTLNSLEFLGLEHGFRSMTEPATRRPQISFLRGYVQSLNNLYGWADGDPFYVGNIGHPMQGARRVLGPVILMALAAARIAQNTLQFNISTRLPMVAGWDHLLPEWFSRLHPRHRTPSGAILFSGALTILMLVLADTGVASQEGISITE